MAALTKSIFSLKSAYCLYGYKRVLSLPFLDFMGGEIGELTEAECYRKKISMREEWLARCLVILLSHRLGDYEDRCSKILHSHCGIRSSPLSLL